MSLPRGAYADQRRQMSREDIMKSPFVLFQSHFDDFYTMSQESVKGIQVETILSKVFFHPKNVDLIQKEIILAVYEQSDKQFWIEKQNEADIQVIMRSIFLQHARHIPDNIPGQIRELNNFVVDDVVPNIMSEILSQIGYLERTFGPRLIMDRPQNVSSAGLRTLPSVTNTF